MKRKDFLAKNRNFAQRNLKIRSFSTKIMQENTLFLVLMCIGASFVQRVSGFGFGIFIMTVLPYLMPSYGEATTLSGMCAMSMSLFIVIRQWKHLKWSKLWYLLIVFLITSFFAVHFVSQAGDGLLKVFLGIILILASLWFFLLAGKVRLKTNKPTQTILGTLSGVMGGLFGMQGPPAVLYFVETTETKEEYMAIAQTYFLIGNLMMTGYRAYYGFLTSSVLIDYCYGIFGVVIGTILGSYTFKHMSLPILKKIIYAYMAVSGVMCLL